jgi:hypothetical protein
MGIPISKARATRNLLAWPLTMLLTLGLTPGCSSGGGGNDGPSPMPCMSIDFVRALATPGAGDVYLAGSGSCTGLDVAVVVSNLSGIFTVGFDITYPASQLSYQNYTVGPLLLKGSPTTTPLTFVIASSGKLQVTMTRFAPDASVTASGSENLIIFHFGKGATGSGLIDFDMSGSSTVTEQIIDENGNVRPASFGPGHGGAVTVP